MAIEGAHKETYLTEMAIFASLEGVKTVFDVGARMRMDASLVPSVVDYLKFKPKANYHLFEPYPAFAQELREATKDFPNVRVNEMGLGDTEAQLGYSVTRQSFIVDVIPQDIEYPLTTLDQYCKTNKIKSIDFLKIDTEGFDLRILQGGSNIVPSIRYIQYEDWDNSGNFVELLQNSFVIIDLGGRNHLAINRNRLEVL